MEGKMEAMEADADGSGEKRRKDGVGGRAGRKKETCEDAEDENARAHRSRGAIPAARSMATRRNETLLGDGTWNEVGMAFRHVQDANGLEDGSLIDYSHRWLSKDKREVVEVSDASLVTASK